MKSVLISGSSGFLGNRMAGFFAANGFVVHGMDKSKSNDDSHSLLIRDLRELSSSDFPELSIDTVIHCAAQVPMAGSTRDFHSNNVLATRNLFSWAKERGASQFVFISSSAIYGGRSDLAITEETPACPFEPYGYSKLEAERELAELAGKTEITLSIIRPRTILGAGRHGIFGKLFELISEDQTVLIPENPNHKWHFTHVDDVCGLTLEIVRRRAPGLYLSASNRVDDFKIEMGNLIAAGGSGSRLLPISTAWLSAGRSLCWIPGFPLKKWHLLAYSRSFVFNLGNTEQRTGFRPRYSNSEILLESYIHFLDSPESRDRSVHRRSPRSRLFNAAYGTAVKILERRTPPAVPNPLIDPLVAGPLIYDPLFVDHFKVQYARLPRALRLITGFMGFLENFLSVSVSRPRLDRYLRRIPLVKQLVGLRRLYQFMILKSFTDSRDDRA